MRRAPCETRFKYLLPALRMALAMVLEEEMGLSVYRIAKILGITPAAVCNYKHSRRSNRRVYNELMKDEGYVAVLRAWARRLAEGDVDPGVALCELCRRAPINFENPQYKWP